jgi:hypothetical protein
MLRYVFSVFFATSPESQLVGKSRRIQTVLIGSVARVPAVPAVCTGPLYDPVPELRNASFLDGIR